MASQDVSKWQGDHVLNGGNKEWEEEDEAMHAYNMQNWRNTILDTEIERQEKQWKLMHTFDRMRDYCCGHQNRGRNGAWTPPPGCGDYYC